MGCDAVETTAIHPFDEPMATHLRATVRDCVYGSAEAVDAVVRADYIVTDAPTNDYYRVIERDMSELAPSINEHFPTHAATHSSNLAEIVLLTGYSRYSEVCVI